MINLQFPNDWQKVVAEEFKQPYFTKLQDFLVSERLSYTIYPAKEETFSAFELTPYDQVKVVLLEQDPYHNENQAHGLCFSVRPGIKPPPSLGNIFKELKQDIGFETPNNGYVVTWAKQGILMLNTVLSVRAGMANSHKNKGWETFTDVVISKISQKPAPVIFVLWGKDAQKKLKLIDTNKNIIIQSAHPSPLSAHNGFFGSKPFSAINSALISYGQSEINWQIPNI
ncbi:uracil-DNA glycosylase [Nostoc punctiforme NIES-2108]|uniref:Uracil-DNA glycosylase n=1 Tax=Nostoc punctiforme NIES-2108 TaxID=1356359 RepID=A0A367S5K8_NOSPU|nr:uracil-DNA glycosylase [Nostoc punctiforme NIES-2108]